MEPHEAFKEPPIYRYEDVITQQDLRDFILMLEEDRRYTYDEGDLNKIDLALKIADGFLDWVIAGKPDEMEMD